MREQVRHVVAPFSPYWKKRFADIGRSPSSVTDVASLATLPAAGERDVSPTGDPAGMAALVLQVSEGGYALHAPGPTLRRALRLRATRRDAYRRLVDAETKPTSYVWSGAGFRYPLASTRGDLDVVARTGARLWRVLGISADDALVSAVPVAMTTEHQGLQLAALATGTPALFPGERVADVLAAARLAPPTVLTAPSPRAAELVAALVADGAAAGRLHTVVLVGAPRAEERAAVADALSGRTVSVLAVHAPAGARVLWAECRAGGAEAGLHTYPDVDLVQLVDPDTAEASESGEVVLTQLGLRGSALLRWRTGDLAAGVERGRCPGCRRTVPRLRGMRRTALVLTSDDGRTLDLRSLAGALAGRRDLADWRVVVRGRSRDGRGQVVVHVQPRGDAGEAAVGAAADVRALAGLLPTQFVAAEAGELTALTGTHLTPRVLRRD